jgi:hypothetical protein
MNPPSPKLLPSLRLWRDKSDFAPSTRSRLRRTRWRASTDEYSFKIVHPHASEEHSTTEGDAIGIDSSTDFIHSQKGVGMGKQIFVITCVLLFSVTIFASVAPTAFAQDEKHMWTVTVRMAGAKATMVTKEHCGTKQEAISAAVKELRTRESRGRVKPEVVSVEKGEKCN